MSKTKTKLFAAFIAAIITIAAVMFIVPNIAASAEAQNEIAATDGLNNAPEVNKLDDAAEASKFDGGTGSETDPYLISNSEQLVYLAQEINNGNYNGTCFKLTDDIDLGSVEWTPIGSESSPFTGIFDGDRHTIFNLKSNTGLFGYNSGTIKNVYLDKVDVVYTGGYGSAALCAENKPDGTIEGCAVLGGTVGASDPDLTGKTAGICAINQGTINRCYNMAAVTSNAYGAGIVFDNRTDGTVSNCYNAGEVSGTSNGTEIIGGICARNSGKIEYCYNYGNVKNGKTVGGICAGNYSGENSGIESCYSDSTVCSAAAIGIDFNSNTTSDVGAKTTAELCDFDFWKDNSLGSNGWLCGSYSITPGSSNPAYRFGKLDVCYPALDGVGDCYQIKYDAYNFKTSGSDDWQPFTVINDADGLKAINDDLSGNYVLGGDIDLGGKEWTPIGSEGSPFTGLFSGDGHTIRNFKSSVSEPRLSAGLFGFNSGTIQNVYVDKFEVKTNGKSPAAGLCGVNNASGIIEGCATLGGSVSASNYYGGVGGVAGICANNSGKINRCYNMASVKTGLDGGGVVNANLDGGTVSNCYNAGEVSTEGEGGTIIGGISAQNWGKIEFCFNYGNVNNAVTIGGICGLNGDSKGTISSCYSDSSVCSAGAVGNDSTKLTNVDTKTTEELCNALPSGFGSAWTAGGIATVSENGRFATKTYTYPSLDSVTKTAVLVTKYIYNFKTDGADDWQEYTLIKDKAGLAAINDDLSGNYVLGDDITLTGEWTPIAPSSQAFGGKFSGNGYTISGVDVNVTNQSSSAGLFGNSTGVIMNLAVKGKIRGTYAVGGICGQSNGTIYACSFNGTVTGTGNNVGGICGYNYYFILNCFSAADVTGIDEVGGICGYNDTTGHVSNTVSVGKVSGSGDLVAAVCGKSDGYLTDSLFDKNVSGDIAGAKDGSGSELTSRIKGMTAADLCGSSPFDAFYLNSNIWTSENSVTANDTQNARKRTATYTYPSITGVGKAYSVEVKEYNFDTNTASWYPYTEISSAEDFEKINENPGGNYVLKNDISIGKDTAISSFTGNFSGDGYTISNVDINGGDNAGLFGANSGLIMNLAVEGNIVGKNNVGGICGSNTGTINACMFAGSVKGDENVGGICGSNSGNSSNIKYCFNSGTVTGEKKVGGLCGELNLGMATDNINVGKVSGTETDTTSPSFGVFDGTYNNNYYNSDILGNRGDFYGTCYPKNTQALCADNALTELGFSDNVWQKGKTERTETSIKNVYELTYTYPVPNGIRKAYSETTQVYNFKVGDTDDYDDFEFINSKEEFLAFAKDSSKWNGNYVLMTDIDLKGAAFSPIDSFRGKFSGNGHTIKNGEIVGGDYTGLFVDNSGLIMNLAVKCDVYGVDVVGGICGYNDGIVYGCSFEGKVTGNEWVGGICGRMTSGEGKHIINCYVIGTVEATSTLAGGICGYSEGAANSGKVDFVAPSIKNCYFVGTVTVPKNAQKDAITTKTANTNELTVDNCYYNSDIYTGSTTYGTAKTTEELCADDALTTLNLDNSIWKAGGIKTTADPDNADNARMRLQEIIYPSLIEVGEPYSLGKVKQYNFKTNGDDDWQPYTAIKSEADLAKINADPDGNYVLMTDIDLKGAAFTPISNVYYGKFSGDGHTIKNGKIVGGDFTGLFGKNDGGLIMNLAVKGDITGSDYNVGGICGYNNGMIYACSFNGSVKGKTYVGGICGYNKNTISNCYAIGTVEATEDYSGGISGYNENNGKIECCYFAGIPMSAGYFKYAICYGGNQYCYYDRELYYVSDSGLGASTTQNLCNSDSLPNRFSGDIWEAGSFAVTKTGGKFRTVSYKYPRLKEGCEAYKVDDVKQYNFKTDGNDYWAQFKEIKILADLENVNNNTNANYVMMNDIDLDGAAFTPIYNAYYGKFSGNGHTIKNGEIVGGNFTGLFVDNRGFIMNLAVKCDVSGADVVGGICGYNDGIVYGCSFEGKVTGNEWVGGICGRMTSGEGKHIINCYVIGTVEATGTLAGGISGQSDGAEPRYAVFVAPSIKNCYFVGTVTVPDSGKKDAITGKANDDIYLLTVDNCYYNSDLYTEADSKGTGLTTLEMTSSDVLKKMGFDASIWEKKANDKIRKFAYYPSLYSSYAPYVKYTSELEFTKVGTETPTYGDEIKFNVKALLKLGETPVTEDTIGEFSIRVGDETVVSSSEITNNTAVYKTNKGGSTKFTLVYKNGNSNFFPEEFTKDLTVYIEKLTLSVDDFEFTPPTDTVFSGEAKTASVTARSGMDGVGAVTVKYYMNGVETRPVNAGTYTVKIDVAEGDIYKSARGLTSEDWTFTIEKATAPAVKVNTDSVPWNKNGVHKLTITGLPENHGGFIGGKATLTKNKGNIVGSLIPFSDGVLTYTVNKITAANLGDTATIEVEIETNNYTPFSVTVEITIVKMTLTAPKNVQVKSGDGKQTITWNAVENAEYYRVQRLDGNVWRTVSQTRNLGCHIAGVSSGKTYSYRVLACDSTSYGPASAAVSATYAGVPKNLKAAAANKNLALTWDKVSGASGYRVQQLKNNVWSTLALPTETTYTVNNLTNGTRYSFRVLANVNGVWSAASAVITAVPDLIVSNVAAEAGSKSVTLTWTSPINAQIYRVQRLEANTWTTIGYANTTRYTDTNVVSGKSYSYRILAFDGKRWCSASETATVDFN